MCTSSSLLLLANTSEQDRISCHKLEQQEALLHPLMGCCSTASISPPPIRPPHHFVSIGHPRKGGGGGGGTVSVRDRRIIRQSFHPLAKVHKLKS